MPETRLRCVSPEAAQAVATEADLPAQNHRARADGSEVVLTYSDKRYPLDVAEMACDLGHATDHDAGSLIGRL